jgi:uncharacterized protein
MTLNELRTRIQGNPKLKSLQEWILQRFAEEGRHDPGHDLGHFLRVALWTIRLGEGKFSWERAVAASLLHDLINPPKSSSDRSKASELSAVQAREILPQFGFLEEDIQDIAAAIRTHSFSRGEEPVSDLGRALQDADRLEALGAIGLYRTIACGVQMGALLFEPEDPWAKKRELQDAKYSIDHFFTKLLKLPQTMKTEAGRREAGKRADFLRAFLAQLGDELGTPHPA